MGKTLLRPAGFLACLLGLSSAPAAVQEGPPGSGAHLLTPVGPLGYWRGDDAAPNAAAADASGNGFNGTCSAGVSASPAVPKTQFPNPGSINLDGAAGVVTVPDAPALRITGDLTVAFWKRRTANPPDWTRMVGKGNGAQRNFGVWESPNGEGRILFQEYGPTGQPMIDLFSPGTTTLNTWHHIACTISVNSAAMWIDGALVANGTRNGEPGTSGDPLTFGYAGFHAYWPGQLDEVRIYNRALSANEILFLAAGNGPPEAPAGLAAAGGREVVLQWKPSATAAPAGTCNYYLVKRSKASGSGYQAVATGLAGTTWTDAKAEPGTTYSYVVTAVNTAGESSPSNEAKAATPGK